MNKVDELNTAVTAKIKQIEDANLELSILEKQLANLLPEGPERNIARRGAIAAANKARADSRVSALRKCWAMEMEDAKKEDITHDLLQERAEKLAALLKERQTGLFSWQMLLNESLKEFHDLLCPLFHRD